ncbi:MAG: TIGR02186 family protein [Beijerinckiaceae bacterium]|nr:TIGR02186 family protein [Beijerinckiaceae bacterium]MCZ8299118.1 TIGR02186 family protein [Beijerinckiaceae bacterium]
MRRWLALALLALVLPGHARAEELVLALSTREVAITSTYTGAEVTVFGHIERDARTIARTGEYDIVAQVQGPTGEVVLHRKGRFGFIWLTESRRRYSKVPLYFSILSAKPLASIIDEDGRQRLKLGLEHFLPAPTPELEERDEFGFRNAVLRLRREEGALTENDKGVTMIRPNLFTARIVLPAKAPTGLYLVNISILSEGVPLRTAQAGFVVRKVGFDAFVANAARNEAVTYGLFTVLMAVLLGWMANVVFRKD